MKQISCERIGAKIKRHYDAAKTPFRRLLEHPFEDVLEEIIGDIRDELDRGRRLVYELDPKKDLIEVTGEIHMRELQVETSWTFEAGPLETVESWIVRHLSAFPRSGESLDIGEWHVTILEADSTRILRARIERLATDEEREEAEREEARNAKYAAKREERERDAREPGEATPEVPKTR